MDARLVELPGLHLAGGYGFDNPVIGRWVGANITSDPETGIGGWSEAQIATAIREGRRPNGTIIGPPMPFAHYRKVSDADAAAMATYFEVRAARKKRRRALRLSHSSSCRLGTTHLRRCGSAFG